MSTVDSYPPFALTDDEMALALNRLAGKSTIERVGYILGWLGADVERHCAGIESDPFSRQALALFRANQYMNEVLVSRIEVQPS